MLLYTHERSLMMMGKSFMHVSNTVMDTSEWYFNIGDVFYGVRTVMNDGEYGIWRCVPYGKLELVHVASNFREMKQFFVRWHNVRVNLTKQSTGRMGPLAYIYSVSPLNDGSEI